MQKKQEKYCGLCCWFKYEDIDGNGMCIKKDCGTGCSSVGCRQFFSEDKMRHYLAVLISHNRWRRDQHVPAIYRMQDPTEIGKAMDFAIEYIKTFMAL